MNGTWASKLKQPHHNVGSSSSSQFPHSRSTSGMREHVLWDSKTGSTSSMHLTSDTTAAKETEEVVANKKRQKKKKNKLTTSSNCHIRQISQNEHIVFQEPPKIQDDEEFPDLASSLAGSARPESCRSYSYSQATSKGQEAAKPKGSGKKSKVPVQLDLGGMLAALEQKQSTEKTKPSTKPLVLSVGGGIPVLAREPVTKSKPHQLKSGPTPHNPLDSSGPLVKKGKQREVPKAKKPTSLKKIILKEREERKQSRSLTQETPVSSEEGSSTICEPMTLTLSPDAPPFVPESEKRKYLTEAINADEQPETIDTVASLSEQSLEVPKIHSRRFREYCSQVLSKEVDNCVTCLLQELVRFQDRMYQKDPAKAKTKRRLVMGLREVLKHLKLGKLKCVIISPNCEKSQSKGGLDDTLQTIITCAQEQNVPCVFALSRKALGRCVNKAVPVSVVGVFSYDGAQDYFHKLCELTCEARKLYEQVATAHSTHADKPEAEPDPPLEADRSSDRDAETLDDLNMQSTEEEEDDEPHYIKVWRQMKEDGCSPFNMTFEDRVITNLFNLHL
uniref:SECIS binding protein 2 n=1 Tax=Leptobrachium leishanense TaxID=445787 RepID=A0A8C5LKS4_9ANUR